MERLCTVCVCVWPCECETERVLHILKLGKCIGCSYQLTLKCTSLCSQDSWRQHTLHVLACDSLKMYLHTCTSVEYYRTNSVSAMAFSSQGARLSLKIPWRSQCNVFMEQFGPEGQACSKAMDLNPAFWSPFLTKNWFNHPQDPSLPLWTLNRILYGFKFGNVCGRACVVWVHWKWQEKR